jgi:hypothetical protein
LNGSQLWVAYPTGAYASRPRGLAVDHASKFVVTGGVDYAYDGSYSYYYGTFQLNTDGSSDWKNDFPQPPYGSSVATAIAVDQANNVYITGFSPGTNTGKDIVT